MLPLPDWFIEWAATIALKDAITWAGVAGAVAMVIWKGWPLFRKMIATTSTLIKLVDTLATLPKDIEFIKHELDANSGQSVKDIATRTERAVGELRSDVAHVKRQAAALKTSLERTSRTMTEHISLQSDGQPHATQPEEGAMP